MDLRNIAVATNSSLRVILCDIVSMHNRGIRVAFSEEEKEILKEIIKRQEEGS